MSNESTGSLADLARSELSRWRRMKRTMTDLDGYRRRRPGLPPTLAAELADAPRPAKPQSEAVSIVSRIYREVASGSGRGTASIVKVCHLNSTDARHWVRWLESAGWIVRVPGDNAAAGSGRNSAKGGWQLSDRRQAGPVRDGGGET